MTKTKKRAVVAHSICAGLCIAAAMSGTIAPALAQETGGGAFAPVQTALQAIVDFITGPFGRLAAIVAVIGLGFMAFAGRLSWFMAGGVIIGIGLVFGAPAIVDQLMASVGTGN